MENEIQSLFELSRDPMLTVKDNKITLYNTAAAALFDIAATQESAVGLIPDHILSGTCDNFMASAIIKGEKYSVSASKLQGYLVLAFAPMSGPNTSAEYLSEPLMSSILSSLFNTGLAIDRVATSVGNLDDPKLKEYLSILYHSYYSIRHMFSDINLAVSLNRRSLDFLPRPTDLAKLCSDLIATMSVLLSRRGVALEFSTTISELIAFVDPEKIERLLLKLLVNSYNHTPEGGTIKIGLIQRGVNAIISVEDNGSGIPADIMKNVFSRYSEQITHDELSDMPSGGLGLGIARGIAELHQGALVIESREGRGTAVHVLLPLGDEQMGRFSSANTAYRTSGMSLVLTELSELLDSTYYTQKYMD